MSAAHRPKVKVVGCQPENSCIMVKSVRAGRILNSASRPTLSEGTAGEAKHIPTFAVAVMAWHLLSVQRTEHGDKL